MSAVKSKIGLLKVYEGAPEKVRDYFAHLPGLVKEFPLDVAMSYAFAQIELAHNMTLYCGAVKIHRCHTDVARAAVNTHHMTRDGFKDRFKVVLGQEIPTKISKSLGRAEKTRGRVMHGKAVPEAQMRDALSEVIEYANAFNACVQDCAGFQPFGPLSGFKGRATPLPADTTRWVLRGMGFEIS